MNLVRHALGRAVVLCLTAGVPLSAVGAPKAAKFLTVKTRAENIGGEMSALGREPMLVELPDGTLFVAGYGSKDPNDMPRLWKSTDAGASWSRVDVGKASDGAIGDSDVDLALAPNGTLYFASMGFNRTTRLGTHIAIGVSKDKGPSWKWTVLTRETGVDRPWVKVAPDGTVYAIWNDGTSVFWAKSEDGGANWKTGKVTAEGGGSSHMAIGPHGEIAVRVTPVSRSGHGFTPSADFVAVSTDGAQTWMKRTLIGERDWVAMEKLGPEDTQRWVEPLAWDAKGNLYALWTNKKTVSVARSKDLGKTWKEWKLVECPQKCFFPYMVVKGEELAATWMSGDEKQMSFNVARWKMSDSGPKSSVFSGPQELDIWLKSDKEGAPAEAHSGGEYDAVMFLRNENLAVVAPVQDEGKKKFGFAYYEFGKP